MPVLDGVGDVLDQARAEHRRRNAEDEIAELLHRVVVRLRHRAAGRIGAAGDRVDRMHAAIARRRQMALRIDDERKPRFHDRTIQRDERRYGVGRSALRRGCHLRIRADERIGVGARARSASEGLRMARTAAGRVVARPQSMAGRVDHRAIDGIDFDETLESIVEVLLLRAAQRRKRQAGTDAAGANAGITSRIVVLLVLRLRGKRLGQTECEKKHRRQGRRRGLHETPPQVSGFAPDRTAP